MDNKDKVGKPMCSSRANSIWKLGARLANMSERDFENVDPVLKGIVLAESRIAHEYFEDSNLLSFGIPEQQSRILFEQGFVLINESAFREMKREILKRKADEQ